MKTMVLTAQLKKHTAAIHQKTLKHDWVVQLFKGTLPRESYLYQLKLWGTVYAKMEAQLAFYEPLNDYLTHLARTPSLSQDIKTLNEKFRGNNNALKSAYSDYWDRFPQQKPHLLIAHFYIRYFGDLLGGQIIKACLQKKYHFKSQELNFYDFNRFHEAYPQGVNALRSSMNAISLSTKEQYEVLDEAIKAFQYSKEIYSQSLLSF